MRYGGVLINIDDPITHKYRRGKHPDTLTAEEKKYAKYSEPTRTTFQG